MFFGLIRSGNSKKRYSRNLSRKADSFMGRRLYRYDQTVEDNLYEYFYQYKDDIAAIHFDSYYCTLYINPNIMVKVWIGNRKYALCNKGYILVNGKNIFEWDSLMPSNEMIYSVECIYNSKFNTTVQRNLIWPDYAKICEVDEDMTTLFDMIMESGYESISRIEKEAYHFRILFENGSSIKISNNKGFVDNLGTKTTVFDKKGIQVVQWNQKMARYSIHFEFFRFLKGFSPKTIFIDND